MSTILYWVFAVSRYWNKSAVEKSLPCKSRVSDFSNRPQKKSINLFFFGLIVSNKGEFMKLFMFGFLFIMFGNLHAISIYDFKVKDIKGNEISLSKFKGSPILIVNVASKCGYTYQYENLEKVYQKYKSKGFKILGFPANNFGSQEPGSNEEIAKFCKLKYDVTFDMMSKISVKGDDRHPLYKFLIEESEKKSEIGWNFEKFLIDKNGKVVGRYESSVEPNSEKITKTLEGLF